MKNTSTEKEGHPMNLKTNEEVLSEFDDVFPPLMAITPRGDVYEMADRQRTIIKAFILSIRKADMEAVRGIAQGMKQFASDDKEGMKYLLADDLRKHGIDPLEGKDLQEIYNDAVKFAEMRGGNKVLSDLLQQLPDNK